MADNRRIVIYLVLVFLIGKFLGLWQPLNIDPYGIEPEIVWGVVTVGFGVLYTEIRDGRKQITELVNRISSQSERLARIEERLRKP